jgi:nucleolar protein 56
MQSYWFGDLDETGCHLCSKDPSALADRLTGRIHGKHPFEMPDWQIAMDCGFVHTRNEYIEVLRSLCIHLAERQIRSHYQQSDIELLQMVRTLDDLDEVINLLTGRAVEWYQTRHPQFSRKYQKLPYKRMIIVMEKGAGGIFREVIGTIGHLTSTRSALMREVSDRADEVLPNTSALVGGLVAARLASGAGGLHELSRLPGSAIQVIGSRTALFSHLRSGTPPPKHGIIFQHRRVHNAPKEVRGRVARVLAAKLGIAARIDYYRRIPVPEFIASAQVAIDRAGLIR